MKLLILSALRGFHKRKIQLFGIIIMIMLSTAIYVGMNSAIDRLENSYYHYLEEQNVEDISVSVNVDYMKDVTIDMLDTLRKNELYHVTQEETAILDIYRNYLLDENRKYDLVLSSSVKRIFEKYEANYVIQNQILDSIDEKYNFTYELEKAKTITEGHTLIKVLPYSENGLNQTYLISGRKPERANEVTILPGYAKSYDIEIGDIITVSDTEYEVVGYACAPDYIYPLLSESMPIFDEKNNNIMYMSESSFESFNGIKDNVYSIKYNYDVPRRFEISIDEEMTDDLFNDEHIMMDLNTVMRITRIGTLQLEFASNRLFAEYFLYLLLVISIIIVTIITKKRALDERIQMGVLKSLGYSCFSIATSYLVYPVLGAIVGNLLGFIIGVFIQKPLSTMLLSFYYVPLDDFTIYVEYLKSSMLVSTCALSILSYLVAIFMLRKRPIKLLIGGSNLKVNLFSRICNKFTLFLPFESRFKYSLAFRSLGKLFLITMISFCTGLLIVLMLIGFNLFSNVIDKSFEGVNYNYIANLNGAESKEIGDSSKSDYILSVNMSLMKIVDKNGNERDFEGDTQFSFTGLDEDARFIDIVNAREEIINSKLNNNHIIVNENARELLDLEIGDTLMFSFDDNLLSYLIVDFSSEYVGYSVYIDREFFSYDLGFDTSIYTSIYSNDNIYGNLDALSDEDLARITSVLSIEDLKNNISKQMESLNGMVYLVITFSSFMVFIIIALIANIVVEENRKTISLMKVIGYDNKKIGNIVLNIYTPFIVASYLLSIPVMVKLLQIIVTSLASDIEVTIPIEISWFQATIGLFGLLIAYYGATNLSKYVLKRVPLSVALKRE